jgi:ketosteroid isomerase-like protein
MREWWAVAARYCARVSQENVDIVRKAIEAYSVGGIEAMLAYADPDIVVHPYPEWLEGPEALHGHDGLRFADQWWTTQGFSEPRIKLEGVRDAGHKVVALYWQSAGAVESGDTVVQQSAAVCSRFCGGRVGEVSYFLTWKEALEAAGLAE